LRGVVPAGRGGQELPGADDVGRRRGQGGAAAVVIVAAELELDRVLQDLVCTQPDVQQIDLHVREGIAQGLHIAGQLLDWVRQLLGALPARILVCAVS
jgi:hypothetical protein